MQKRRKILLIVFCFLFSAFCRAEAILFRRDADETSWHLCLEGERYVITAYGFTGEATTQVGTFTDSKDAITFQDKQPNGKPSVVHGKRFLKKKIGETVYLVEEPREEEFRETAKAPDDFMRTTGLGNFFHQVTQLPNDWGIYAFLKAYAAKYSENAVDYFYVSAVKKEQKREYVYAYWMTGNSILVIDLPSVREVDFSRIVSMLTKRLRLDTDVVPTQKEINGSTYLVTSEWAEERIKECLTSGQKFIVEKKQQ